MVHKATWCYSHDSTHMQRSINMIKLNKLLTFKIKSKICCQIPNLYLTRHFLTRHILTYIPSFKRIHLYLQNPEQIQMCIIFMLKQPTGGHFEFPILVEIHPYGMSLYLAIWSPNIKTSLILWSMLWSTGKIVIFHR